jgi:hypothetical protein
MAGVLLCGLLLVGVLAPTGGWSQTADPPQQVEKRLADKQAAAEAHRKQMESLKDPQQLATAMQQHFQMLEEILALMLERRKLMAAQTAAVSPAPGVGSGMQGGGMPGMGMMGQGMGMMGRCMGMGMMGQGMGMPGGGMQGGMSGGCALPQGTGSMSGGSMPSLSASGQRSQAAASADMEQMMQRIAEHSAYMETLKDPAQLAQERLRHQKMLDQMLQLMR